jgi:hypothetical protein
VSIERLAVSSGFIVLKYVFMISPTLVPVRNSIRALVSSAVFPLKVFNFVPLWLSVLSIMLGLFGFGLRIRRGTVSSGCLVFRCGTLRLNI